MTEKYSYGNYTAEVVDASGVSGVLIREVGGDVVFRVYNPDMSFVDYDVLHDDLPIIISKNSFSAFYSFGDKKVLDHSPNVLGLQKTENDDKENCS